MDDELLGGRPAAVQEARLLLRLLETGSTVAEVRELIEIPPGLERRLLLFAQANQANPEDRLMVLRAINFRLDVARHFEQLLAARAAAAPAETVEPVAGADPVSDGIPVNQSEENPTRERSCA